jgi:hypothetical protein
MSMSATAATRSRSKRQVEQTNQVPDPPPYVDGEQFKVSKAFLMLYNLNDSYLNRVSTSTPVVINMVTIWVMLPWNSRIPCVTAFLWRRVGRRELVVTLNMADQASLD